MAFEKDGLFPVCRFLHFPVLGVLGLLQLPFGLELFALGQKQAVQLFSVEPVAPLSPCERILAALGFDVLLLLHGFLDRPLIVGDELIRVQGFCDLGVDQLGVFVGEVPGLFPSFRSPSNDGPRDGFRDLLDVEPEGGGNRGCEVARS